MTHKIKLSEQSMQAMEAKIPELASAALRRAYYQALTHSGKVLEAVNGQLVETSVDGTMRVIRQLPPSFKVTPGTRFTRKAKP